MSSDDSDFDKEAEREKLREKYGDEDEERENTRRMSELLLKGATMTGKHCNHCGDPIFRYDGQEFCPTCQQEAQGGAAQQGGTQQGGTQQGASQQGASQQDAAQQDATQQSASQQDAAQSRPESDSPEQSASETEVDRTERDDSTEDEPRVEINDVRVADQHADRSNLRQPPSQQDEGERSGQRTHRHVESSRAGTSDQRAPDRRASDQSRRERVRDHARAHGDTHSHDVPPRDAGDLGAAREALVRKLTDLSRKAEETDDVARARDLLAATREAAEALAALDRANR